MRALAGELELVASSPAAGREQVVLYRTRFLEADEVKAKQREVLRRLNEANR